MTTNTMTCESFNERLMAYLEHDADEATRASVERHALTCAECGALLADVRRLRIEAADLPDLEPSGDLWAGIASRIEAPVVAINSARGEQRERAGARRWAGIALFAASLVAAAGIGYVAAGERGRQPVEGGISVGRQPADTPLSVAAASPRSTMPIAGSSPAAPQRQVPLAGQRTASDTATARPREVRMTLAALTADYDREIARLRRLIELRRNQLDPVTVAIIEKNLDVIDAAIAECQKAIALDPESHFLIESLDQSFQTKMELMRIAALLPSRT